MHWMNSIFGTLIAGMFCLLIGGCVSTYDQPLASAHYNRNNYVAPNHVRYYKDHHPGRNTRPNVYDHRYDNHPPSGYQPKPPSGHQPKPPSGHQAQPPSGHQAQPAKPATPPQSVQPKKCKENKDCPAGQRCQGGSARTEGVCKK